MSNGMRLVWGRRLRSAIAPAFLWACGVSIAPAVWANTGSLAFVQGEYTIFPSSAGTLATVQVAGITSTQTNGVSGSAGFELWYSSSPYGGGSITGYKVAASYLPIGNCAFSQLAQGTSCTGITVYDNLTLPPAGTYYPVLLLVEYSSSCPTNGGYCSDDFIDLVNLDTGGPTVTVSPQPTSGGGSGTGGTSGTNNNAQLTGTVSVGGIDWTHDLVDIQVANVANTTPNVTSGSLEIQLWFTAAPYASGTGSGFKVASFPLPATCTTGNAQLAPGKGCSAIDSGTIPVSPPPAGTYYATVILVEYSAICATNGGYCSDTVVPLTNQEIVPAQTGSGGGTGGSGASSGASGNAQLSGAVSLNNIDWNANTTDLRVAAVTNTTQNVTSGSLALQVWYTTTPYLGGSLSGYKVASIPLFGACTTGQAQLAPGQGCASIDSGTIPLTPPPAGTYYVVVALNEYDSRVCTTNGGYCLDNAVQLSNQETVPSAVIPPVVTAATGGTGGGGALNAPFVCLLGSLLWWNASRRRCG